VLGAGLIIVAAATDGVAVAGIAMASVGALILVVSGSLLARRQAAERRHSAARDVKGADAALLLRVLQEHENELLTRLRHVDVGDDPDLRRELRRTERLIERLENTAPTERGDSGGD
jgi:hypothetical protein